MKIDEYENMKKNLNASADYHGKHKHHHYSLSEGLDGPLVHGMGHLGLKLALADPALTLLGLKAVKLPLNVYSERLQYLMLRIESGPPVSEKGIKFHPFHHLWLRHSVHHF